MGKFIEEFYYGNIDPQARSTKQNNAVQKQMEVLMLNEDFLTESLSGENKKKFLDFVNAWSVVNGESNLDSFMMGFRLGANFTYVLRRLRFKAVFLCRQERKEASRILPLLCLQGKQRQLHDPLYPQCGTGKNGAEAHTGSGRVYYRI